MKKLAGQVAIVTGAGRGIGRAEALALAAEGAKVVVNDFDDAGGGTLSPAGQVVGEIAASGGIAIADSSDVTDWKQVETLLARAIEELGGADMLVCNAGFLRNNTTSDMTPEEWTSIIRVHLDGAFIPAHHISRHWQAENASGRHSERRRIVLTTSMSGLHGNPVHVNYSAAKAGVTTLALCLARELLPFGATVNAVAPRARTRLNEHKIPDVGAWDPANVGRFVAHLCALPDLSVTGQVFAVGAGAITLYEGWHSVAHAEAFGEGWTVDRLQEVLPCLFEGRESVPTDLSFIESAYSIGTGR